MLTIDLQLTNMDCNMLTTKTPPNTIQLRIMIALTSFRNVLVLAVYNSRLMVGMHGII